jgi:hypothetical protein
MGIYLPSLIILVAEVGRLGKYSFDPLGFRVLDMLSFLLFTIGVTLLGVWLGRQSVISEITRALEEGCEVRKAQDGFTIVKIHTQGKK